MESDEIGGAQRYERSPDRVDTRAGHYERKLETQAGAVTLKVPKLRSLPFETAIIQRYRRKEASVEEALVEMIPGRSIGATGRRYHRSIVGYPGKLGVLSLVSNAAAGYRASNVGCVPKRPVSSNHLVDIPGRGTRIRVPRARWLQ